ncbi:OmpW/AlkL family protein [Advenella sp. RU8]|uniref:OmpW/AlkL family protein n=1 Tax=Advenella sp. RU8 TaxID=3399575 RepID=UPI003AAF2427
MQFTPKVVTGCLVAMGIFAATPVMAHEAGDWLVKVGVTSVMPKSNNGTVGQGLVPKGIGLDVNSNMQPSFSLTYMATKNVGIELLAATPFSHKIYGDAPDLGGDLGKIGKTKHLPPTLSVQWHFLPDSDVQPYVGVGLNYTKFFDTKPQGALKDLGFKKLKLEDSWGLAAQVGVDIRLSERWFMNADLRYIDIDSKVKLDGQRIGTAKIDPWVATVGVGYRF